MRYAGEKYAGVETCDYDSVGATHVKCNLNAASNVSNYSIKDLEHLSGIKAHTLRMWEQRYGLLAPERAGGNNERRYGNDEMRYLLNVSLLNRNGYKISRIAKMTRHDVENEVLRITAGRQTYDVHIDALIVAMVEMNESRFEKLFNTALLQHGFEKTILEVMFPFMQKIGVMWQVGSIVPAQEHFVSNLLRQKMVVAIDGREFVPKPWSKRVVLCLPENELHELSLLFLHYKFRAEHHRVYYLGQSVPFSDLQSVVSTASPDYIFSVFTAYPRESDLYAYVKALSETFPNQKILLAGLQLVNHEPPHFDNVIVFNSLRETVEFVESLSNEPPASSIKQRPGWN